MRYRSRKREAVYRTQRRPLVAEQLALFPTCRRCHARPSVDVHEVVSRGRGGSITDRANVVALCRQCHDHLTRSPREAEREGYLLPSASLRHPFTSADGYYCDVCQLPPLSWRHREDAA